MRLVDEVVSEDASSPVSDELRGGLAALHGLFAHVHAALLPAMPAEQPPPWPREPVQFACYEGGGSYAPHEDAPREAGEGGGAPSRMERAAASVARVATAIYYVGAGSTAEEQRKRGEAEGGVDGCGGELRLWPQGGGDEADEVAPVGDRLVVFWSNVTHAVRAVRGGQRCAFTQWYSALRLPTRPQDMPAAG